MTFRFSILFLLTSLSLKAGAQAGYDQLAMQSMLKGDYKIAVAQLEKADANTPNNPKILKMLAYSYLQCTDNENAVTTYSKLITLKPDDYTAYYYRGKARLNIANAPKEALNQLRDGFYTAAIKDFSKAIELNAENDIQYYQNRGIAYKDYGIFKSYKIKKSTEKAAVIALFNNSIADFQKILISQPLRKDIINLTDYVKAQIASLK